MFFNSYCRKIHIFWLEIFERLKWFNFQRREPFSSLLQNNVVKEVQIQFKVQLYNKTCIKTMIVRKNNAKADLGLSIAP